ncbi:MAG TPA: cupin domain-containing protein [Thermodesulfobacteriota bacterium]|nr:cupin domain-containing protein [Thermodesulfobacteriota bacterium]
MQGRMEETWKACIIGFCFAVLLFPSGLLAQGKEYKIFTVDEFVKMDNPEPGKRHRLEILTDKDNATKVGGIVMIVPATALKAAYHYHKNRESLIVVISGQATEVVEGKKIPLKAGQLIYIPPMVKHVIYNSSDKEDLRYMEFFTPTVPDVVEVKE